MRDSNSQSRSGTNAEPLFSKKNLEQEEILAKKRDDEILFMEAFYARVHDGVTLGNALVPQALSWAADHDLGTRDALHLAAALIGKAEEWVTLEKPSKPLFRVPGLRVASLYPQIESR